MKQQRAHMMNEFVSKNLLIHGGRIVDPSQGIDDMGELLISNNEIARLSTQQGIASPENCLEIDAGGMVVCPGFIDIHCHLRQPGFEEKETIATGTKAAAKGGFTTICCMPNTDPPVDTEATVKYIRALAALEGVVRVLPIACVTKGRAGTELADFGELSASGAVAFSDDGSPVSDALLMRHALLYSAESGLPIIDHCEDLSLSHGGVMNAGSLADRLRVNGIPVAAEENMVARDIELARATGGRLHIAHVSSAGSVELIRSAKKDGLAVTAEVTPHHLTMTEEMVTGYNTNAKVNPPLRTSEDIAALFHGLREGVIDVIATDHAPHSQRDKECPFYEAAFGISGFETALGSLMGLVHRGEIDLITLISKLTYQPALFLRRTDLGTLKPGTPADVTIFDPEEVWLVNPDEFISKGRNTPLAGHELKGRVMVTIVRGAVVYDINTTLINRKVGNS
jgi:dihydroorotase